MNGGVLYGCRGCECTFEVRMGTHPEYCPSCGENDLALVMM